MYQAIASNAPTTLLSADTICMIFGAGARPHMHVARDRSGELWLYNYNPHKCPREDDTGMWCLDDENGHKAIELPEWMFPEVRWEDMQALLIINSNQEV
ncbi:MAG: hypothetical protein OEX12_13410 [Gammaproteobacteria bacterium]|nr:hypothetical protein [Gammaproteobacteria bacterium]